MADKEVTTFVIDVGPHMYHKNQDTEFNDLELGLKYVDDVLISKIMRGRKTDYVLAYANGTNESSELRDYVSQLHEIKAPTLSDMSYYNLEVNMKKVKDDLIMASLLGSLEMFNFTNKKKFKKNLIIITNSLNLASSFNEPDVLSQMIEFLNENQIKFIVIGSDFNEKSSNKENIYRWKDLISKVNDSYLIPGDKAIELINYPNIKPTRPTKLFEIQLRIGANLLDEELYNDEETLKQSKNSRKASKTSKTWENFQKDPTCVSIGVDGYPGIKSSHPLSFKQYGVDENGEIKPIKAETTYEIRNYNNDVDNLKEIENTDDHDLLNKSFEIELVDKSQLVEGFRYGRNTVVLNEILKSKREYKTVSGLDIRGVIDNTKIPRVYISEDATLILGSKDSKIDQLSIAALVDALTELKCFAIGRFVKTPTSQVQMVVLIPVYIKKNGGISTKRSIDDSDLIETRAFIMNRLPFYEDEKIAIFSNLTDLKTSSGKVIKSNHPLLSTNEMDNLMDSIVTKMDLGTSSTDIEDDKLIFNPTLTSSLLPLPESRGNHDNLIKLSTGNTRIQQSIKEILINSSKSSVYSVQEYVKEHETNLISPLSKELEKDIRTEDKLLDLVEDDFKKLSELLNLKTVDKTKPRKRKVLADEIQVFNEDDDFVELSLEQLLEKGFS